MMRTNGRGWLTAALWLSLCSASVALAQPATLESRGTFSFNKVAAGKAFQSVAAMLGLTARVDAGVRNEVTAQLSDVRLRALLDAMCESARCRWRVEGHDLVVEPDPAASGASGAKGIYDAVNRLVGGQTFRGKPATAIVKALAAATVPGCHVELPKMLDPVLALEVKGARLIELMRQVLGHAGLEVDFRVTGTLIEGTGTPRDCTIMVVTRREPGRGVFAITSQGLVELKIFGEDSSAQQQLGPTSFYRPGIPEQIVSSGSVQSLLVNLPDWGVGALHMVVSRGQLRTHLEHSFRLRTTTIPLGPGATQIFSADLAGGELQAEYRRRVPAGTTGPDAEAFLLLETRSAVGLKARTYPIRLQFPPS